MLNIINDTEYRDFFHQIKERVRNAQLEALRAVNKELVSLYWDMGKMIVETQEQHTWGDSVVETLAKDLQKEFAGMRGFSLRNLYNIRAFYLTYRDLPKLQSLIAEISWTHNLAILERCQDEDERRNALRREFYTKQTIEQRWSSRTLKNHLESQTFEKFLLKQTNFEKKLPSKLQKDAQLLVRDEYNFSFLGLSEEHKEQEIETALIAHIEKTLMTFGNVFAFVGRQYRLELEGEEYFVDILLYHRKLRCLVAVELKTGKFRPEYAGKMNFYLNLLNDTVRLEDENPSIGIILCKEKKRTTVEYALGQVNQPMGVAEYRLTRELPQEWSQLLPSVEDIEQEMNFLKT
ncbi:MAG: DUF1016 family protein [SAR324 cluster bacterium]|nr:DUF1016 family protein [SAR324 cluster bacterium]